MHSSRFSKNTLMYEGSVKRIYSSPEPANLVFEFTDDYSVFDWGKMPDTIPHKGAGLAKLMAVLFERLEDQGVKTHFKGFDGDRSVLVEQIGVYRPERITEGGRNYYTYPKNMVKPFLIPLEVVFRFEVCAGSSFIKRHPEANYQVGHKFVKPYIEMFTKLEDKDRPLTNDEALKISGLTAGQFEQVIMKTAQVAELLKNWFAEKDIRLMDGKLEWGLSFDDEIILVDAIGPDEMRLEKNNVQLSKEVLRDFYRETPWYDQLEKAKAEGESKGFANWKSLVKPPPPLPTELKKLVSQMYSALVSELIGEKGEAGASLNQVVQGLTKYQQGAQS
ncbi:phosphoribosylaminoimidazolesuccinocarboxamide synthase [Bdellovibrio sp. HCB337]|uniref:phosphoribosylaminoimidazolesuccinocarboxamide synthase n=1 Tax=Bdellovibrio sp. HCB337 TaxID=3394358 RepID=UPI0039A75E22